MKAWKRKDWHKRIQYHYKDKNGEDEDEDNPKKLVTIYRPVKEDIRTELEALDKVLTDSRIKILWHSERT